MKTLFLLLLYALSFSSLVCVTPTEKKIKEEQVPQSIRDYVKNKYPTHKKPKYYLEVINDTTFYEVEIKNKQEKLSLRFLKSGELYEIEKEEDFENLPSATRENVKKELSSRFVKYKILEVEFLNPQLVTQYEVQVKGKSGSAEKFYEFNFDSQGKLLRFKEVLLAPIQTMF